jgi:acetoin utilization deacetylase AcuC-like enzyme
MALRLYYCDHHEIPLPDGHKFPIQKYRLLREILSREAGIELATAPMADRDDLERVHDSGYIAAFLKGMLEPAMMRRIGFPWSEHLVRRTLASVGGTVRASLDAMERGFGGNLAGGTHHAFPDHGTGFCIFNDVAVAVRKLMADGCVKRVAVVDLDVHQGDGTAFIFRDDERVLTVSVHGARNFPFRKQESKLDVALPDETEDEEYVAAVTSVLPRVVEFSPDVVFYQTGVDGLGSDVLGRLSLSHACLAERDRLVFAACRDAGIPVVATLGGGYANPIEDTVEAHLATFRTAVTVFVAEAA